MASPIPPSSSIPATQTISPVIQAAKGILPNLTTGSIILAQVVRSDAQNPAQIKQGLQRIQLKLEGKLIAVTSNKAMTPGSTVKLQVTGPNQWMLLPNTVPAKTIPADQNAWLQAQRQSLPAQAEVGSIVRNLLTQSNNLTNLAQNSSLNPLAKILLSSNRELLAAIISKKDTGNLAKLISAIKSSGLTFESKLLSGQQSVKAGVTTGGQAPTNSRAPTQSTVRAANKQAISSTSPITKAASTPTTPSNDLKSILLRTAEKVEQIKPAIAKSTAPVNAPLAHAKSDGINPALVRNGAVKTTLGNPSAPATQTPNSTPATAQTYSAKIPIVTPAGLAQSNSAESATQAPRSKSEIIEQVLRQLNGGIAKIEHQQLQSVGAQNQWNNPANVQNSWVFELPVLNHPNVDGFNIRIDQEKPQTDPDNAKTENGWVITLGFDLDKLGPISVKARLVGDQVSMDIWSQRPEVLSMVKQEFAQLEESLVSKGLEVKSLKCHAGQPKEPRPVVEQSLLHIET